jgi:hypothetical protein
MDTTVMKMNCCNENKKLKDCITEVTESFCFLAAGVYLSEGRFNLRAMSYEQDNLPGTFFIDRF